MRFKQVPKELQHRVILYYEQRYRRNFFNENIILENVSDVLRKELQMFNCRSLVEAVPLMQGLPQGIIQGIVARLKFEAINNTAKQLIKMNHFNTRKIMHVYHGLFRCIFHKISSSVRILWVIPCFLLVSFISLN